VGLTLGGPLGTPAGRPPGGPLGTAVGRPPEPAFGGPPGLGRVVPAPCPLECCSRSWTPFWRAMALTQAPIPRWPLDSWLLQVATASATCWPHTCGSALPVTTAAASPLVAINPKKTAARIATVLVANPAANQGRPDALVTTLLLRIAPKTPSPRRSRPGVVGGRMLRQRRGCTGSRSTLPSPIAEKRACVRSARLSAGLADRNRREILLRLS